MQNEVKDIEKDIVDRFGAYILTIEQVSKLINKSPSTLERLRKAGTGIKYRKIGTAKNGTIEYTTKAVAEYIASNQIRIV